MSKVKWSYKTVHFELKREGLLGGSFLDEAEIEERLNDFGHSGWELISVIEVQDGIIAFFKQSLENGNGRARSIVPVLKDNNLEPRRAASSVVPEQLMPAPMMATSKV